jgi:FkbM family methyltransferase
VHGYYNWRNLAIADVVCRPGDTIVEIGANVGTETVGFSDIVGEHGTVHAFEPFSANVEQLRKNAAQTRYRNVNVFPVALSDRQGQLRFVPPWIHNSGNGHVVDPADVVAAASEPEKFIQVPCATLDSLGAQLGRAQLLAIDAEGHEVAILKGAGEYLRAYKPTIIIEVVESRLAFSGATPKDVARHLHGVGYELFEINRFGARTIGAGESRIPRPADWLALPSDGDLIVLINRALRRCALMPMMRGLNPLCHDSSLRVG